MFMPEAETWSAAEVCMAACEKQRYPFLYAAKSTIRGAGRGVFTWRDLREHDIVCSAIGQIRLVAPDSHDNRHPCSYDLADCFTDGKNDTEYSLRMFPQSFANLINSSEGTELGDNCVFDAHPHFKEQRQYYVDQCCVYPSGAQCVRVKAHCTVWQGGELLVAYYFDPNVPWHTELPPQR
jgi:hypothetical protein